MAFVVRFNVHCTICKEIFQNDYVEIHTKSNHKDLYAFGRIALVYLLTVDYRSEPLWFKLKTTFLNPKFH